MTTAYPTSQRPPPALALSPASSAHVSAPVSRTVLAVLFIIWWGCNNLFALHAHRVLTADDRVPMLFVDLSVVQIFFGVCMSYIFTQLFPDSRAPTKSHLPEFEPSASRLWRGLYNPALVAMAVFHMVGTQLTNSSYALIGSTSTLVWKLTEPLTAVVLKRTVLGESSPFLSVCGMLLVLFGALLFSAKNLSLKLSPVILANLFIPMRNILVKRQQHESLRPTSSAQTFFRLCSCALPFCVCSLLVKNVLYGFHMPSLIPLFENALLYNSYQLASIALLERMDVLTHSLANTLKRFSAIAVTAFATGEQLTVVRMFALLLTAVGFPMHIFAKHKPHARMPPTNMRFSLVSALQLVLVILLVFGACTDLESVTPVLERLPLSISSYTDRDSDSSPEAAGALSDTHASYEVSQEFVLSVKGGYISTTDVYRSEEEALTFPDTNCGNMLWQFGGYVRLVDFTKSISCNDTHVNCNRMDPSMKSRRMVHYRPAANGFNRKMNPSFHDTFARLSYEGDLLLYVGIGTQHSFKDDESRDDMRPGEKIENSVETFSFTDPAMNLLRRLNHLQIPMFMRGDFTVKAAQLAGYNYGVSTGCPSLFINEEIHLGALLEEKYRRLMNSRGKKSLKIAFNLTGRHRLFKWMKSIADLYPGSLFYAQGPEDFRVLRNHNVSFDKVRFYGNVPDWLESLSQMDLSIGPRIHGNMAAVGAGTPVFVVAPDFRVLEMSERMKLPHMTMYDERLEMGMDVADLISTVGFDGSVFDTNRCQIAKTYKEGLGKYGLHLSAHAEQISNIC